MNVIPAGIETDRDRPPGAGAAPGRTERTPRATFRRGEDRSQSAAFFVYSSRTLFKRKTERPAVRLRRGEFKAQARWSTAKLAPDLGTTVSNGTTGGDEDSILAQILAAIASEVQAWASGARAEIVAEFAGKILHAKEHLPAHQVAGAVRALGELYAAALSHVARIAQAELFARREAAIRMHKRPDGPQGPRHPPLQDKPGKPNRS